MVDDPTKNIELTDENYKKYKTSDDRFDKMN
jgi:hypothetical protein